MPSLLLIEPSTTLRRILARQLQQHGYALTQVADFAGAAAALGDTEHRPDAIVLGWPAYASGAGQALLERLGDTGAEADLPLTIIAHHTETEARAWARPRPNTVALTWDELAQLPAELERLLSDPNTVARIIAAPVREPDDTIRVLLVDDSVTVRYVYQNLLERNGYQVATAASADEALQLVRREPFDIAIVDYHLNESRGDSLARALREDPATAHIAAAILTGTYRDQVVCDALSAGAVECMVKNEAEELFLARIAALSRTSRITRKIDRERQRLAGILGSVGDGVFGVDRDGIITFVNPAALRLLGLAEEAQLVGQPAEVLFGAEAEGNTADARFLKAAYEDGVALNAVETTFRHRTGSKVPVECTIYPLRIDEFLEGSVIAFRNIADRKLLEEELRWQANHDPLTRLFNRKYFEEALEHEVRRLKRSHERSALLLIDLDQFKAVNEALGHSTGDALLAEIGQRLRSRLRHADVLARLGSDHFGLLLRNLCREELIGVADQFRELLCARPFQHRGRSQRLTASIGVSLIDGSCQSPSEALGNADIACHIAQTRGGNQTHVYTPEDRQVARDLETGWSARLHQAVEQGHFRLDYQPITPLAALEGEPLPASSGALWHQIIAQGFPEPPLFEVLLRMPDTNGADALPGSFLPAAERFNLMRAVDRWVLNHALEALATLQRDGTPAAFSINLSGQSMDDEHLVPFIASTLTRLGVDPLSIVFEITETEAIANLDSARRLITALRGLGCRFALDDFGSGYSSFPHLKHLPVDFIKIDGAFVQGIATDPMDRAIVSAINDIAHSLGKLTIAEAVENAEAVRLLRDCGVDYVQGFYVAEPAPTPVLPSVITAPAR